MSIPKWWESKITKDERFRSSLSLAGIEDAPAFSERGRNNRPGTESGRGGLPVKKTLTALLE